jgi:hypothetical protein
MFFITKVAKLYGNAATAAGMNLCIPGYNTVQLYSSITTEVSVRRYHTISSYIRCTQLYLYVVCTMNDAIRPRTTAAVDLYYQ